MTKPVRTARFDAVAAEAPPLAEAAPAITTKSRPSVALRDDEIIQISIRPSPWFVLLASFWWLVGVGLLELGLTLLVRGQFNLQVALVSQALFAVAAFRVGIATLQWAARTYILTNRRIMRIKGVFNVHVAECPLARISAVHVYATWYQHLLNIGTIRTTPADEHLAPVSWTHIASAGDFHDMLVRAIRKAQLPDT